MTKLVSYEYSKKQILRHVQIKFDHLEVVISHFCIMLEPMIKLNRINSGKDYSLRLSVFNQVASVELHLAIESKKCLQRKFFT